MQEDLTRSVQRRARNIDWRATLTKHRVAFVEGGPNTAKNNVYVRCPFCNIAGDEFFRLGISLDGHGWGCWRKAQHRGKSPSRLLAALLGTSQSKARELLGEASAPDVDDADLKTFVSNMFDSPRAPVERERLSMPQELRPLWERDDRGRSSLFIE